jgi:hypothetical protein
MQSLDLLRQRNLGKTYLGFRFLVYRNPQRLFNC